MPEVQFEGSEIGVGLRFQDWELATASGKAIQEGDSCKGYKDTRQEVRDQIQLGGFGQEGER